MSKERSKVLKWVSFLGKLIGSLIIIVSVILLFFNPTMVLEVWKWIFIVVLGALDVVGVLILISMGFLKLVEFQPFHKIILLFTCYIRWLTSDFKK